MYLQISNSVLFFPSSRVPIGLTDNRQTYYRYALVTNTFLMVACTPGSRKTIGGRRHTVYTSRILPSA